MFTKGTPKPANSGRKKGTPNKATDLQAMAIAAGVEPFKVLLELCTNREPTIRLGAAKEAAKYLYPQRKVSIVSGPEDGPIQFESSNVQEIVAEFKNMLQNKFSERKD